MNSLKYHLMIATPPTHTEKKFMYALLVVRMVAPLAAGVGGGEGTVSAQGFFFGTQKGEAELGICRALPSKVVLK